MQNIYIKLINLSKKNRYSTAAYSDRILILLQILIPLILIMSWFKDRQMIAYAEEGFLFHCPDLIISKFKHLWINTGFGSPNPFYFPRLVTASFIFLLHKLGFLGWQIQAIVFYFLLLTPLLFIPKLVELLYKPSKIVGFTAGIFYLFNLFTISQVWGRFILSFIFLWSYLPLFLYIWVRIIRFNTKKDIVILLLSTFVFLSAFGHPANMITIYIPVFLYLFIEILKRDNKWLPIYIFFKSFIIWILFNIWWLFPAYKLSNNAKDLLLNASDSTISLVGVSKYFSLSNIFVLKQDYLFSDNIHFNLFYSQNIAVLISLVILLFTFIGFLKIFKDKKYYLIILFAISLFIIKGANSPFGVEFYNFIFKAFPASQVLRNPYEKVGVVFILPYSIFFAVGVYKLFNLFSKRKLIYLLAFSAIFGWYMMPFWRAEQFPPYSNIDIPSYYSDANQYLNDLGMYRILHLPLLISQGVEYDWGYKGGQKITQLFNRPIIGSTQSPNFMEDFYIQMRMQSNMNVENYSNLFQILNIKHIIINEDIVVNDPHDITVSMSDIYVNNWNDIVYLTSFDSLKIHEYSSRVNNRLYMASSLIEVDELWQAFEYFLSEEFNVQEQAIYVKEQNEGRSVLVSNYFEIPSYEVEVISPTEYNVLVKNSQKPFYLILSDTFNPLWTLTVDSEEIGNQILVNGFANGWLVDKMGSYKMKIKFKIWPWD